MSQAIWCCCSCCHFISSETPQTHSKHRSDTAGFPRPPPPSSWQRASCPHKHPRFSPSKPRREARSWFIRGSGWKRRDPGFWTAPALDAFFSLDRAWHQEGNQPWLQGLLLRTGLCFLGFKTNIESRRLCRSFGCFAAPWGSIQPDLSVPWSPHQPGPERRN